MKLHLALIAAVLLVGSASARLFGMIDDQRCQQYGFTPGSQDRRSVARRWMWRGGKRSKCASSTIVQVTAADYQRCVLDHACPPAPSVAEAFDRPAVKISWHDANAYALILARSSAWSILGSASTIVSSLGFGWG